MPAALSPKEKVPGASGIGGCVEPSSVPDALEQRRVLPLPGVEPRFFCRLSRNTVGFDSTGPRGSIFNDENKTLEILL